MKKTQAKTSRNGCNLSHGSITKGLPKIVVLIPPEQVELGNSKYLVMKLFAPNPATPERP